MSNRRMQLSEKGKIILDTFADTLEVDRPMAVKIALAKGLSISNGHVTDEFDGGNQKWTIPEGIIKDKEFLLFKHLIINEISSPLDEADLHKHMLAFIEKGLRKLDDDLISKTSMEDFRLIIL
jgi:hypothetical protein